ncbi:MAG: hypothetical protein ACI9F9_001399 [Candidatus Paceibacteria bacterium]|jgi:hypothetical protein
MAYRRVFQSGLTLCLLGLNAFGQSGGIEIFSGETLFYDGTRISLAHLYEQGTDLYQGSDKAPNPDNREYSKQRLILGYNYGLNARLTIGALMPVVDPELGRDSGQTGSAGLGDTTFFGKWRLYTHDRPQNSRNLSLVFGLETPTGRTGSVPPQPGSGSWNPFAAFALTEDIRRWRYDAVALFKVNTEGTGSLDMGDELSLSASVAYRYLHRPYPGASNSAKLGLLWQSQGSANTHGMAHDNSGSERLYLRPSLGFHPNPAIDISISFDLPLSQHYSGTQLGEDFRTFFAVGYRF